jgi:V/A-type H+-transporting ATPase subunit C
MAEREEMAYAHAVARIRALEAGLLVRADLDRIIAAPGFEEAWKAAREPAGIAETWPAARYEEALSAALEEGYAYVASFLPGPEVTDWLRLRHDYHNLKVVLKELWLGERPDPAAFSALGSTTTQELRRQVEAVHETRPDAGAELPQYWWPTALEPHLRRAVAAARAVWEETGDPQLLDVVVDRAMFAELVDAAAQLGGFVREFARELVDTANLRVLLRVQRLGKDRAFLERVLIDGGQIPRGRWPECFGEPIDRIAGLVGEPYGSLVRALDGDAGAVERAADNLMLARLRSARLVAMGPEPVLAYLWQRENDLRNVRIIMSGKLNGVPAEAIRERLRDTHV